TAVGARQRRLHLVVDPVGIGGNEHVRHGRRLVVRSRGKHLQRTWLRSTPLPHPPEEECSRSRWSRPPTTWSAGPSVSSMPTRSDSSVSGWQSSPRRRG